MPRYALSAKYKFGEKPILYTLVVLLLSSCTIFEKQERLIFTKKSPEGILVKIYYVELGATTNDVIQIRKVDKDDTEVLVKSYDHNFVRSTKFLNKVSFQLVLTDTTDYGFSKKTDTVIVDIR